MVVLGLDLGTKGGFSRYDTISGELFLGWNRWDKLEPAERCVAFGEWLEAVLEGTLTEIDGQVIRSGLEPVGVIGYEDVPFTGRGRSDYIAKQTGLLEYLGRRIAWRGVNVATLKKFATGNGKAEKPTMIAAARYGIRELGSEPPEGLNDDMADAFLVTAWILVNALKEWEGPV